MLCSGRPAGAVGASGSGSSISSTVAAGSGRTVVPSDRPGRAAGASATVTSSASRGDLWRPLRLTSVLACSTGAVTGSGGLGTAVGSLGSRPTIAAASLIVSTSCTLSGTAIKSPTTITSVLLSKRGTIFCTNTSVSTLTAWSWCSVITSDATSLEWLPISDRALRLFSTMCKSCAARPMPDRKVLTSALWLDTRMCIDLLLVA